MEYDTVAKLLLGFYRLTGAQSGDGSLTLRGESADDIGYLYLTRGARAAQRWLIDNGLEAYWRSRSSALSWSGTESSDGGRYTSLPTDFLRLWGDRTRTKSALVEADGDDWGTLIDEERSDLKGDFYYLKGGQLWVTRDADLPATLYLEYHHQHPAIDNSLADGDIDFPMDGRPLIVAESGMLAAGEAWLPGGEEMEARLDRNLKRTRYEVRKVARRTREARRFARPPRAANHW